MIRDYYLIIKIAHKALRGLRELNRVYPMLDPTLLAGETEDIYNRNSIESPLVRLPAELRNKIFGYVYGGMTIVCHGNRITIRAGPWASSPPVYEPFVALQQTCRQIYIETALLPFSKINKFWYYGRESIHKMRSRLLIAQQNAISTIHFSIQKHDAGIALLIPVAWGNFEVSRLQHLHEFPGLQKIIFYCVKPFDVGPVRGEIEQRIRELGPRGVQIVFQEVIVTHPDKFALAGPPTTVCLP